MSISMEEGSAVILVNTIIDAKTVRVPFTNATIAEDACLCVCKQLGIGPVARNLFALREHGSKIYLALNARFTDKNMKYDFRIRYKVPNIIKLKRVDIRAYDYLFHQARIDVLENKIPDIIYEKYKRELVGLGVADMYRVMLEKDIARDIVENDYKKYIPKEVIKRHSFFIKKPIHDSLGKIKKCGHDAWYVKAEYLKQLEAMAPEYLAEEYRAVIDMNGSVCSVYVKVSPFNSSLPGIRVCYDSKREDWQQVCTIDELCFVSVRNDGTVEISRKNGIPSYLKFHTLPVMQSFVSLVDGYYRLMVKWTFNLCKDMPTPSLQRLYAIKCHGPVGGEFSYAKLEEKRNNRPGCFILRESETKYSTYYIDVCTKHTAKPKSYKLEKIGPDDFIFNDDLRRYKSVPQLMAAYNDPDSLIFLQECLPPSEYDNSPLLLCQADIISGDSLTDSSSVACLLPTTPICINTKDLQVYKDLKTCKLSHLGIEFSGEVTQTEGGIRCQSWSAKKPIHKIDESIIDAMFIDGSKVKAQNYCRNPKRRPDGPWCYSMDDELIDDTCGIPLCRFTECRATGSGMEYGGLHNKATSGKACLKWDKRRPKVRYSGEQEKFSKRRFPDETRADAKKYCRNPDGDIGGPWCYVRVDNDYVQKQYCDIPFCDDQHCVTFTRMPTKYTHYTMFNATITNLTFGVKLWNADSYLDGSASILLSLFTLPLTDVQQIDLQSSIEVFISNKGSALKIGNKDDDDDNYEESAGVLQSAEYTFFSLMWSNGFVTLSLLDAMKPIFLAEYKANKGLFKVNKDRFFYYSLRGSDVLWSMPLCDEDDECELHTTTSDNYERFWPLYKSNTSSYDLKFYVRAFHSASIMFQSSPAIATPARLKVQLSRKDNTSRIVLYEEGVANVLKSATILRLLDFWEWHEFTVTFFSDTIQVYWFRDVGMQLILETNDAALAQMRWYSPGSAANTLVHWTFFCSPKEFAPPPAPWPPECVLNNKEIDYKGRQSVTNNGRVCLPWAHDNDLIERIGRKTAISYWNYCRDPFKEVAGTFCYVVNERGTFERTFCGIRLCKSAECRMAGTANDYIGNLNVTRSNRTCQAWTAKGPHKVDVALLNGTLYAEQDVAKAANYCRDPSRNIAGTWCYTTDPNVPRDLCNVRDCARTEECTVMTKAGGQERMIYILPSWKERGVHGGLRFALKEWHPDKLDGILFEIIPLDGPGYMKLIIGAEQNEKVELYKGTSREDATLIKSKRLPHLIPAGKWAAFRLNMRRGEISLAHEGTDEPLFDWQHDDDDKEKPFEPGFMTYMSIQGNIIGVHFKCNECHTERTTIQHLTRIMSLGMWNTTESVIYTQLSLYLRGTAIAVIPLFLLPGGGDYLALAIGDAKEWLIFFQNSRATRSAITLNSTKLNVPAVLEHEWTHYLMVYTESTIHIYRNNVSVLEYTSPKPMLFYWFSISAEKGWLIWTANCEPPDIDGPPRDGGWSAWGPWTCTVSCGGGDGYRTRSCTNPTPNIKGQMCEGPSRSTGRCNNFECGDISPKTMDLIRDRLTSQDYAMIVDEGERVTLTNDVDMLKLIRAESPKSFYKWTFNGVALTTKQGEIDIIDDAIQIREASTSDTGVYICMIYRINDKRIVLRVASLAVRSATYDLNTRETFTMLLESNAVVLGYVYSDLIQRWFVNDTICYIDYGITTLAAVVIEQIKNLNASLHAGWWTCVIQQAELKLQWTTNVVRVSIRPAPTWLTHLMEDEFTRAVFGTLPNEAAALGLLLFLVVLLFLIVFACLMLYLKYGTLPRRKYRRLNSQLDAE